MRVAIFKYQLSLGNSQIEMPRNAKILHIGYVPEQAGAFIWVKVDPSNTQITEIRNFYGVATGEVFDDQNTEYVGTVFTPGGFVWHFHEFKP